MASDNFSDAALVLVGHGSTQNAQSIAPVCQHADHLRQRNIFAEVLECFWMVEPSVAGALRRVGARRVFIVPLFISEGYFTQEAIPGELGLRAQGQSDFARVQQRGPQTLYYCDPIGTHESMTGALLARARQVVGQHPFPCAVKPAETALFIAGHGTGRNENSRQAIERQVELIGKGGKYAEVYPAFIEEEPRIANCYQTAHAKNIVVVPFFISDGLHTVEDIPILLGESARQVRQRLKAGQPTWRNPTERKGKRLWYSTAIGSEPLMAEIILERAREMARSTRAMS